MINFSITVSFVARKSAVFPKRPSSSENLINTSNTSLNDKENNKPTSVSALTQKPPTSGFFSNKTASSTTNDDKPKTIESTKPVKKPSFTSANTGSDESNKVLPAEVKPDVRPEVTKATPTVPAEVPKVRTSEAFSKFQQEASVMPSSKPTTSPEITKCLPEVNKGLPEVSKVTSAIGWKPAVLQSNNSASVEDVDDELNLEQRVSKTRGVHFSKYFIRLIWPFIINFNFFPGEEIRGPSCKYEDKL